MKQLSCDMCGSTNVIKEDGLFVCQTCGTKYSVEEARKMMMEGTVEVEGTVKIDQSDELKNLYEIARRAKETNNSENALKYYDQILVKDPNSWEAQFYVVYFKAMGCKIAEIDSAAISITNCIDEVLTLVKNNVPEDEQEKIVTEIYIKVTTLSKLLFESSKNHFNKINYRVRDRFVQKHVNAVLSTVDMNLNLGNKIISHFDDKFSKIAVESWKAGIDKDYYCFRYLIQSSKLAQEGIIKKYTDKIRNYDAEYISPVEQKYIRKNKGSIFKSSKCPFCKAKLSSKDVKFCTECGARVN